MNPRKVKIVSEAVRTLKADFNGDWENYLYPEEKVDDSDLMMDIADYFSNGDEDEYSAICKTGLNVAMLKEYAAAKGYKRLILLNVNTDAYGICDLTFNF